MAARSAKPLFRAIKGRKRAPEGQGALMELPEALAPGVERRALDFYPTGQPEAIRALLARDGARIAALGGVVWEPAVGDGALAREIEASGLRVIGSDVEDRGWPNTFFLDFMRVPASPARAIITNPPYSEINARDGHGRWLRHTLELPEWRYLALLLSWDWPAARQNGLGDLLDQHPFTRACLMRWKLDFTGEGSPPQRNAWFVWDRDDTRATDGSRPHPEFCWLDRRDNRQGKLI
jgi:hypothetical protein